MSVNPGALRHRVTVQTGTSTNAAGGVTTTWADDKVVWARVTQVGADGAAKYQQAGYSNVTHEVLMRYRAARSITLAGSRLVWRDTPLEVIAPALDKAAVGRFVTIACREVTDAVSASPGGESS